MNSVLLILVLGVILLILLFVPFGGGKKAKAGQSQSSALPNFLKPEVTATSPFQLGLQEDAEFLVAAYREHALAEKKAEVAAKAAKYFSKSE